MEVDDIITYRDVGMARVRRFKRRQEKICSLVMDFFTK
jgi:hypothetical protein